MLLPTANRSVALQDENFSFMISQWEDPMFAFAWHYLCDADLAKDLVVSTFVRFHQRHTECIPQRAQRISLFQTLAESCRRHAQRSKRIQADDPLLADLVDSICSLPHERKTAWLLQQCTPLDEADIAAILGIDASKTSAFLSAIRSHLKLRLQEKIFGSGKNPEQTNFALAYDCRLSPVFYVSKF